VSAVVFTNILSTATVTAFNVSTIEDFTVRLQQIVKKVHVVMVEITHWISRRCCLQMEIVD
jgi:hypothetical protein